MKWLRMMWSWFWQVDTLAEVDKKAPDNEAPYRPTPFDGHDPHCQTCAELDTNWRYRPPETMLEAGFPFPCLQKQLGMTQDELIDFAERNGMRVMRQ